MRASYLITFILVVFVGLFYWYQSTAYVCPVPLHYRLGELDDSFELTADEARQYIKQAETYWEDRVKRDLFIYDESASFTVNFIFDERQELANEEETQQEILDRKKEESEEIRQTVEELQQEYNRLSDAYDQQVAAYEQKLKAYNLEVNKYNDRGGAPADVYDKLEEEREELNREAEKLNQTAAELNDFASEINRLGERGNLLVDSYNQEVDSYNSKFGFEREFTQGDYQGGNINVYKFSTEEELLSVLGHEFGHALGIGHVDDTDALMYYLLEGTDDEPTLTVADLQAFYEICGRTESFGQKVRRMIRELL